MKILMIRILTCTISLCKDGIVRTIILIGMAFFGLLALKGIEPVLVPQYDNVKHLGVASCDSSQCHGAVNPYKKGNIRRNEYQHWSKDDKHSQAYEVLGNQQSQSIAQKIGLSNPQEAKMCLDCHSDNVPQKLRGEKFQIRDGIGCEACHGGAERWIKSHTEEGATHSNNIANGMYPTELPRDRAKLCLSCHYGDSNKLAIHKIMAAGHPRLRFELDSATIRQEHYDIDDDYQVRKKVVDSVNTWAIGMTVAASENAAMLWDPKLWSGGLFPEIALFDCHACHHLMKDRRWMRRQTTVDLSPGAVRLNDSSFTMLYGIATAVDKAEADRLLQSIRRLHEATANSREAAVERSRELDAVIGDLREKILRKPLNRKAAEEIQNTIIDLGAKGELRDYSGAEQGVVALDLLTFAINDKKSQPYIDKLFTILRDDTQHDPAAFSAVFAQLQQSRKK